MKTKALNILSSVAAISLVGILITQTAWLKRTIDTAEKQFDHRADQMLEDVVEELRTFTDTSSTISAHPAADLQFYDVLDTVLLKNLLDKYIHYHTLDTSYNYALVITKTNEIIQSSKDYMLWQEDEAYMVCLSCIWKKEYIHLSVFFPNREENVRGKLVFWVILSLLFTLATIGSFIFILITLFKQKKIAEIKNDFVNNMTHELKTPLSTISIASEVLMQANESGNNKKTVRYSKIIFDENHRMRKLVDKVLNIATLDKGLINLEKEKVDIHSVACKAMSNFCLDANSDEILVNYELNAINHTVLADPLHITNIITNLIDNAIKYSLEIPEITINTQNKNNQLLISISDKGKGISKESQKKVFDKFYRVPSGDIHNVKGFGLGLYYVKTIVDAHNWKVNIHSSTNKGTTISIIIPL